MSPADPDSALCPCGHMRGIHKARDGRPCMTGGCGCRAFGGRIAASPPAPPRVIPGRVERELPPAGTPPVVLTRVELAICPGCDIDRCDTCYGGTCKCACDGGGTDTPSPQDHLRETMTASPHDQPRRAAANFAVHLAARLRALGWTQAHLTDKSGLSSHVTGRALNGNGADLDNAEKLAGLVGSSLATMIGPYMCSTCAGEPPKGYSCLECGTEARAA